MLRTLVQICCLFLPWPLRRRILTAVLGFAIDKKAYLGLSLVLADEVLMMEGSRLGHFNYVGRLDTLRMEEDTYIGNFNWIAGLSQQMNSPFFRKKTNRRSDLVMGRCSMIAHQNYIDCTDRVTLGKFSGIAGTRSQIVTHGVEPIASRQTCAPISIGDYSMVGAGSMLLKGVKVPEKCIVSAGSVVTHVRPEPYCLIGGNPAVHIRKLPEDAKFFFRETSVIL